MTRAKRWTGLTIVPEHNRTKARVRLWHAVSWSCSGQNSPSRAPKDQERLVKTPLCPCWSRVRVLLTKARKSKTHETHAASSQAQQDGQGRSWAWKQHTIVPVSLLLLGSSTSSLLWSVDEMSPMRPRETLPVLQSGSTSKKTNPIDTLDRPCGGCLAVWQWQRKEKARPTTTTIRSCPTPNTIV